jgi:hypothetical protein
MLTIPGLSYNLLKTLDEEYPARCPSASDFADEKSKVRYLMYAGKRELIEGLLRTLETQEVTATVLDITPKE